nr:ISL3 family transposase [Geodermatophilus chilensis]
MSSDGTTILFGLPGVRVQRVVRAADGVRVVHVVTDEETAAACPECGVLSSSVRQRRTTRPRDLPYGEAPLAVRWHKVQYACRETACVRRAFTEQIPEVPAGARVTGRLRRHVAGRVADGLPVSTACAGVMGWPTAHAAFVAAVTAQLPDPEPVAVLGIDETRRGKPRWTRTEDGQGWVKLETFETNFVDLAGAQGLLGQASGRTKANVVAWLDERGQAWKDAVAVVAIDPCATYRAAVAEALPHARIVADHFHLVRLANQALTDVRRGVTWDLHGRRGRASDPAWARRRRLLRGYERLTPEQFTRMWNDLVDADPTSKILTAWIAKEELRRLLACARRGGHRHEISTRLHRFTPGAPTPGCPNSNGSPARSRPGGPRSKASCRPASPTPAPRPPTGR